MTRTSQTNGGGANLNPAVDYGSIDVLSLSSFQKATILDELDPLILEREKSQKRKILGTAALIAVFLMAVFGTIAASTGKDTQAAVEKDQSLLDDRFSSLLVDDKAFFFPAAATGNGRRSLKADDSSSSSNPWALEWEDNKESFAAIGAYYRAKGKALKHYYKSMYDPNYNKTSEEAGLMNATLNETFPWAFDWKKDAEGGMAMAKKYKSIGDAIDEHYQQVFDPTYYNAVATDDNAGHRFLRAATGGDAAPPVYDWVADRDRGTAIEQHFKELGELIEEHYQQPFFDQTTAANDPATPVEWSTAWTDFKSQGRAIGKYYHDKGVAISRFYEQQKAPDAVSTSPNPGPSRSASITDAIPASSKNAAAKNAKNDWYIWGMDWQNDKEHATKLQQEMKAKGQTIANHYRAKYDPTFVTNASAVVSNDSWDGLSFPAWGEDAEADKAHGKAIGDYWASHGKEIGKEQNGLRSNNNKKAAPVARDEKNDDSSATSSMETVASGSSTTVTSQTPTSWKEQGKNTGKFWEDFYRSRFDPTYNAEKDLNW